MIVDDIDGARKAVQKLIDDPELRKKLIENGYKTAKEWNWNHSIDLLEQVLANQPINQELSFVD